MKSDLEASFLFQIKAFKLPIPEQQYKFHPQRRWKFDFYFEPQKLAVEVEGGTFIYGRHNRPEGFENDCVKYNEAILMGIRILRFTKTMIDDGRAIEYVRQALKGA